MRAFMSGERHTREMRLPLNATWFPDGHVGGMADRAAVAMREARAILEEVETTQGERWDNSVLTRGNLKHHLFLAAALGESDLWDAADAYKEALEAFVQD